MGHGGIDHGCKLLLLDSVIILNVLTNVDELDHLAYSVIHSHVLHHLQGEEYLVLILQLALYFLWKVKLEGHSGNHVFVCVRKDYKIM
jgi:hypothetical protein